jgi:hypothetical protein
MNVPLLDSPASERSNMLQSLFDLSIVGLRRMFLPEHGVFCDRLVQRNGELERQGISHRYTLMTLLGLYRYELMGGRSGFAVRDLTIELVRDTAWLESTGDLGLLLWACSEIAPDELEGCVQRTRATAALDQSAEAESALTMEIAWFLTGISTLVLAQPSQRQKWEAIARHCYALLKGNRGQSGFFGHRKASSGVAGALRGRIGSFADQVYPCIALAKYGQAFEIDEALTLAVACAQAICNAQGSLGQWWWHYDAPTGRIVQRYPVYSVHQEAMGPMALFAVKEATGRDFDRSVMKGLEWISGSNELRQDFRDPEVGVVWRCLRFRNKMSMLQYEAQFLLNAAPEESWRRRLSVLRECRPYELGWLLYAFCRVKPEGVLVNAAN